MKGSYGHSLTIIYAGPRVLVRLDRRAGVPMGKGTTMTTMQTNITPELFAKLPDSEAVLVNIFTNTNGDRWGKIVDVGSKEEMDERANVPGLFILPAGMESITVDVVLVSELGMPETEDAA